MQLDKIPEGSKLEIYVQQLTAVLKNDMDAFPQFMEKTFIDCLNFVKKEQTITFLPRISLKFARTHEEYLDMEQKVSKRAIEKEVAIAQSSAFTVGNRFDKRICVDVESFINLLKHGCATFVFNLVETYIHEILHCAFHNRKSEQEIHSMQCPIVETFLGIELSNERKNLKASDYYSKSNSTQVGVSS